MFNIKYGVFSFYNITNLVTNAAVTVVENKIADHSTYITSPEFNKLTAENFCCNIITSKIDIANLVRKSDFNDKIKNLNKKISSNKTKHMFVENEFKKLQIFDSSLFTGQSYILMVELKFT